MHHASAATHEQRCLVLASLPDEHVLHAFIRSHLRRANSPKVADPTEHINWLASWVDGDFLSISDTSPSADAENRDQQHELMLQRSSRFDLLLSFMSEVRYKNQEMTGTNKGSFHQAYWDLKPEFVSVIDRAFENLARDNVALSESASMEQGTSFLATETTSKAMACACALGLTDRVEDLFKSCPESLDGFIALDETAIKRWSVANAAMRGLIQKSDNMPLPSGSAVTPLFFAIQFSQEASIAALRRCGLQPDAPVVHVAEDVDASTFASYDATSFSLVCTPTCKPETFDDVVANSHSIYTDQFEHPRTSELRAACLACMGNLNAAPSPYLDTFVRQGLLDKDIEVVLRNACITNNRDMFERFQDVIPWTWLGSDQQPDSSLVEQTANYAWSELCRNVDDSSVLVSMLRLATRQGQNSMFEIYNTEHQQDEPIATIVQQNLGPVLLEFLKQGFDVQQPSAHSQTSTMDLCKKFDCSDLINIIKSFASVQEARKLLADLPDVSPTFSRLSQA